MLSARLPRLVFFICAALAIAGCAQTREQVSVGVGTAGFKVEPAAGYARLYLP